MALTFLNPAMIDQPANIPFLSAGNLVATNTTLAQLNVSSANIRTLSANNSYLNNLINNVDVFGNLTVYGAITALSGAGIVNTFVTSTTALSVVNVGVGPALFVSQGTNTAGVASFVGTGQEIFKVNNIDPDLGQASVIVSKGLSNKSLSATGTSYFDNINSPVATIDQFNSTAINSTNINAASAVIGTLTNTTLNVNTVNSNLVNASNLVMPTSSTAFFGNMTVYGFINAISGIQNISSFISNTSALSVVNTGATPALFVKQSPALGAIASFIGSNVEVLRVVNPDPAPAVPGILVTGNVSASNVVYSQGGNSNNWNSDYTVTSNNSASWISATTNVQSNSANWEATYTSVNTNQTNWTNVFTHVRTVSSTWQSASTNVQSNSANWNSTYTTVQSTSASWNGGTAALTNLQTNSAIYVPTKLLTAGNFMAQAGLKYLVNTSLSVVFGTLPAIPLTGSVITFEDPFGTWDTNNFILLGNGNNIESTTAALSCNVEDSKFDLTFVGGSRGWKVS